MKPLLNSVATFSPADLLIDVRYADGRTEKYLPVNARVMWALIWAKEKGLNILIDDKDVSYDQETKQMIAVCNVWLVDKDNNNRKPIATTVAGKYFDPEHMQTQTPIQDVCTMAKGRALSNLGFSTAACGIQPEHREGVGPFPYNFREVKNFEPADYLIDLVDPATAETRKYMEVKYRLLWAQLWANANKKKLHFNEYVIGYDPKSKMYMCGCDIIDEFDRILATGVAGKFFDPHITITDTPIQNACTAAKGRALTNLGFGTFYGSIEEGDTSVPCDAGIPVVENNPIMTLASGGKLNVTTEKQPKLSDPATENVQDASVMTGSSVVEPTPDLCKEMPLDEALAYEIKTGKFSGKTVGELNVTDEGRKYLKYCVNSPRKRDLGLYSAALTVCKEFNL